MPIYYLSFVKQEEGGFVGGCFVQATSVPGAVTISHIEGINPGGEVLVCVVDDPDVEIPDKWMKRLLDRDELVELDRYLGGDGKLVTMEDVPYAEDEDEDE